MSENTQTMKGEQDKREMQVYYLNWDKRGPSTEEVTDAEDLYHDLLRDEPDAVDKDMYRHVTEVEADKVESVFVLFQNAAGETADFDDRSMSKGDVVVDGDDAYLCLPRGWKKLEEFSTEVRS